MNDNKMVIALLVDEEQAGPRIRHSLPDNLRNSGAGVRFFKSITANSGEIHEFEFDFVPDPTWEQFTAHISHNCNTCLWKQLRGSAYCPNPTETLTEECGNWDMSDSNTVYKDAQLNYYKNLHEEHYGRS